MQMMYEMIYKALKEAGLDSKYCPQDYLNFFCLGNRETPSGEDGSPTKKSTQASKKEANTPQVPPLAFLLSRCLPFSFLEATFSNILEIVSAGFFL